jgi:REP element-mobilizing transposase RayT
MPQSLAQLYTHLVFSTKNRERVIHPAVYEDLRAYFGGILRDLHSPLLQAGVVADHVHLLYRQSKNLALIKVVEDVKTGTSEWIKTKGKEYSRFHWQNGYGAFSVSASRLDAVRQYILNQESHHATVSFQEEFRRFLAEYEVEYDERYVWD